MLSEEQRQNVENDIGKLKEQKTRLELQQEAFMPHRAQIERLKAIKRLELEIKLKDELINGMD